MASWGQAILNILYPPRCPACRQEVGEHGGWCEACLREFLSVREINLAEHHLRYLDCCLTVCEYAAGVKRVIHALKFQKRQRYAIYLRWLLRYTAEREWILRCDAVVPVPLAARRLRERGYNQVERIFARWAKSRHAVWLPDALLRTRDTAPQWELNVTQRHSNIKGAFTCTRPERIKNRSILLVDDIITTGVTLNEAAKALKAAGADRVCGLTLAAGAR
jgi:ComF family protein